MYCPLPEVVFQCGFLPPVWFLRMVTHLHCSTLASLLLDPNTVLGPMNLQTNKNRSTNQVNNHEHLRHKISWTSPCYNFWDLPLLIIQLQKKKKKLNLHIKLQLVHVMARLNTKSEYILCTVYGVSVRVCTYAALFQTMTSLSSPPDARYRPLLDQRTQLTQAAVQNTKHHRLSCQTLADRDNKQNLEGKLMMSQAVHGSWLKDPAEQTPLLNWLLGHQFTDTLQLIDCC